MKRDIKKEQTYAIYTLTNCITLRTGVTIRKATGDSTGDTGYTKGDSRIIGLSSRDF